MNASSQASSSSPLYYISTTDYVQHKYAPHESEALEFCAEIERLLHELHSIADIILEVAADHGMNDKYNYHDLPRAVHVTDLLHRHSIHDFRVVLPITHPYVKHHDAFNCYASIYINNNNNEKLRIDDILQILQRQEGIYAAMNYYNACMNFELPYNADSDANVVGGIVVLGDINTVLGKS